jgi:cysteine synthase A
MQGWSPDFIPNLAGDAVDVKVCHRTIGVTGAKAIPYSKELAQKEDVGITAGGTLRAHCTSATRPARTRPCCAC